MKKETTIIEIVTYILAAAGAGLLILVNEFGMTSLIDMMKVVLLGAFMSAMYLFGTLRGYTIGYDEGYFDFERKQFTK